MEFPREKFGEVFHAVENLGGGVMAWLHGLLSSEKIEALRLAAESSAAGALAEVLPPETRAEQIDQWLRISKPYLIAGGGGGGLGKMMKTPGRSYRMPRADFECDPRGYLISGFPRKQMRIIRLC